MNFYLRYFDDEVLVYSADEAIDFLYSIPDIGMTPRMEDDVRAYLASDQAYPKRYKVRPHIYFIIIKTIAATMEDFKQKKALRGAATALASGEPQDHANEPHDNDGGLIPVHLSQQVQGWYEGCLDFKRVLMIPATGKFEYRDTHFVVRCKANSGLDCYNRMVDYLRERVDGRSQFPSPRGKSFYFKYLGMWK